MSLKTERVETMNAFSAIRELCTESCSHEEAMDLKKFYMNKYGNYMAGKIGSIIFLEFIAIFIILNTGIDSVWDGIPYAETVIYGTLWGSGGLYLAHMLVTVIRDTYYLKLALEAGSVKKSACDITFHERLSYREDKKNTFTVYIKKKGKNIPVKLFTHKSRHKGVGLESNAFGESPGTKLIAYSVDDKKNDLFIMVKNKPVGDSVDKVLSDILNSGLQNQKFKLNMLKAQMKNKKKK